MSSTKSKSTVLDTFKVDSEFLFYFDNLNFKKRMNFPAKYFLLLIISTLSLSISAQYDCNCGNVTLTNLTKNPSRPGCSVIGTRCNNGYAKYVC